MLIAGRLNSANKTYYWKVAENVKGFKIGDYAIAENGKDYDLIKIIGIIETDEIYEKLIAGVEVTKYIVKIIPRETIQYIK